jgi:hypothetical protein
MKKTLYTLTTIIIFCSFCSQCKKSSSSSQPVLPPITQTGANTFGCKINGQVWLPYYPCNSSAFGVELAYNFPSLYDTSVLPIGFAINAGRKTDTGYSYFGISVKYGANIKSQGKYY